MRVASFMQILQAFSFRLLPDPLTNVLTMVMARHHGVAVALEIQPTGGLQATKEPFIQPSQLLICLSEEYQPLQQISTSLGQHKVEHNLPHLHPPKHLLQHLLSISQELATSLLLPNQVQLNLSLTMQAIFNSTEHKLQLLHLVLWHQ